MTKSTNQNLWKGLLFAAILMLCMVMALIPGAIDPTGFINDKLKHGITFFGLALMLDCFAFPIDRFSVAKPLGLFAFGGLIEVLQDHIGYRQGNAGDLTDMLSNLSGIGCYFLLATLVRYFRHSRPGVVPDISEV